MEKIETLFGEAFDLTDNDLSVKQIVDEFADKMLRAGYIVYVASMNEETGLNYTFQNFLATFKCRGMVIEGISHFLRHDGARFWSHPENDFKEYSSMKEYRATRTEWRRVPKEELHAKVKA